jgi:hypothetical protein
MRSQLSELKALNRRLPAPESIYRSADLVAQTEGALHPSVVGYQVTAWCQACQRKEGKKKGGKVEPETIQTWLSVGT